VTDVLLIIDVQRALLRELPPARRAELLGTLVPLLNRARSTGLPVVFVRHDGSPAELIPGTPEWEIASELAPRAGEPIVEKRIGDAFAQTALADVLAALDADHLIVTGMQTDFCVNATIGGATERGYRVTLVADGHATSASSGRSEQQIREAMHEQTRARGAHIISAAELFG
jgi:nicotinamidase-related amidase